MSNRMQFEKEIEGMETRKEDMDAIVMNYLVTEGYYEAVEKFCIESGTEPEIDLARIAERMAVKRAVLAGNVQDAIEMVNDLNPEILDTNPQLFFHLHQQRMIEFIRHGELEQALEVAQEVLAPIAMENQCLLEELERTISLLAFEDAKNCPYAELLDVKHKLKTACEINSAILMSQNLGKEPRLQRLLKIISWVQWKRSLLRRPHEENAVHSNT